MPPQTVFAICAALLIARHNWRPAQHARLPAASDHYLRYDPGGVVILPDSGGFPINRQPMDPESLGVLLKAVLAWSDTARRFAFVEYTPPPFLTLAPRLPSDPSAPEAPPRQ